MSFASDRISIDISESYNDLFLEFINNFSSYWNGRQINLEDAINLNNVLQDKVFQFLFSQNRNTPIFGNRLSKFTQIENNPPYFTLANRNIDPLFITLDNLQCREELIMQAGLGKYWQKHKKEIIIITVITVVVVSVVAITIATYGMGSQAAATVGAAAVSGAQICLEDDHKKESSNSIEKPAHNQDLSSDLAKPPIENPFIQNPYPAYKEPLFLEDGVLLEDKYYPYWELLQKAKQEELLTNLLNTSQSTSSTKSITTSPLTTYTPFQRTIPSQPGNSLTRYFFETFGREVAGQEFMADAAPSRLQKSHLFTTSGERPSSCRIGGINGINTSLDCAIGHADYIGGLTSGKSIDWVYNNSHGILADLFLEVPLNYSGMSPNTANLLKDNWVAFHKENKDNPKAKYLQFCHSQGVIHVKNALENAPQEIRDRVMVVAIAPAMVIPKELCFRSSNYASKKDIVPLGEVLFAGLNEPEIKKELLETALEYRKELILLDPHPDATGIDHDFQSPTFKILIKDFITDHVNCNGEYE